jgi:hypothetical protein
MSNNELLNSMRDLTIIGVTFIHDYVQIFFDNEGILSVFSPMSVLDSHYTEIGDLRYLVGRKIRRVNFKEARLRLLLDDNGSITIQCNVESDNVPEALTYSHSRDAPLCIIQKK